ncbi:MAG TPA: hypothetical protein VJ909_03695 [Prolixibacteraceae bacterium]|nr:hypothetical protein [Prolixibacteraceae bacterium]
MFRTEVVKSKNLRKSIIFKVYNAISIILLIFIIALVTKIFPEESEIGKFINENYTSIIQPVVMGIAFFLIIISIYTRNASKNPKRIGSLELDTNEARFLIDDEVQETIALDKVKSIEFEFFSFRMRGNPMGCMNYLTFFTNDEDKNYEIVIANTMVKAELGDLLREINKTTPVKVKYAYFLKKIFGDRDFKFEEK